MTSTSLFSFQPRLRSYSIRPSGDHPTELVMIEEENGAALGINHEEKRVIELMNGERSVGEILKIVVRDEITYLRCVRQLLWDLDRFGFLRESPWGVDWEVEGQGYWGGKQASYSFFTVNPILGWLETWLGGILLSPYFQVACLGLFLFSLLREYNLFYSETPFLIHQSAALGLLVVVVAILGGFIVSSWFGVMMLRAVYPAPVKCVTDYRFGLPIFRLDGRRLRALSWYKGLLGGLAPASILLLISGVSFLLAGSSEGIRREWLFHLSCSWWVVCLLLVAPWNSTLLSRDLVLRLRGESVLKIMVQAVRKAFCNLIQYSMGKDPYERLFLAWGIWTVLETLLVLRLITMTFRWNLPVLVNYFLQEENRYLLAILFFLFALGGAALVSALMTFIIWLSREIYREMRSRFWPRRDHLIVALLMALLIFLCGRILWGVEGDALWLLKSAAFFFGLILAAIGGMAWWKEGDGFECWVNIAFVLLGVWLVLWGSVLEIPEPLSNANETLVTAAKETGNHGFSLPLIQGFGLLIAAGFLIYTFVLYAFCFEIEKWNAGQWIWRGLPALVVMVIFAALVIQIPFRDGWLGGTARWFIMLLGVVLIGGTAYRGGLRNYSTVLCIMAVGMIIAAGYIRESFPFVPRVQAGMIAMGSILAIGGVLLRSAGTAKTALNFDRPVRITALPPQCDIKTAYDLLLESGRIMYGCMPNLPKRADMGEDSIRNALNGLNRFAGKQALRAMVRRTILNVPWKVTQRLFSLLPVSVAVPRLTDWNDELIMKRLKQVPTFSYMEHTETIVPYTRIALFDAGDTMIEQNETGAYLFILVSGNVAVEEDLYLGRSVLAVLDEGDFVGEIGFLSGERRTASVRALEPVLALSVHQEDIRQQLKKIYEVFMETDSGDFWLQQFERTQVCREFNPSLSARVCLESQHVTLHKEEILRLGTEDHQSEVAIFLAGKAVNVAHDQSWELKPGSLVGVEECLDQVRYQGMIRAESTCQLLIVDQSLFTEAIMELLTPKQLLHYRRME